MANYLVTGAAGFIGSRTSTEIEEFGLGFGLGMWKFECSVFQFGSLNR